MAYEETQSPSNSINLKLSEILNKYDFNKVLQDEGILDGDVVVEIVVTHHKPTQLSLSTEAANEQIQASSFVLGRVRRYCPCNPGIDPPNAPCCYK